MRNRFLLGKVAVCGRAGRIFWLGDLKRELVTLGERAKYFPTTDAAPKMDTMNTHRHTLSEQG